MDEAEDGSKWGRKGRLSREMISARSKDSHMSGLFNV